MKFNINGKVRVRLTEKGRRALYDAHQAFWATAGQPDRPYHAPREDCNGWSEWQLHALMSELGHLCHLGQPIPFETEIKLEPFE